MLKSRDELRSYLERSQQNQTELAAKLGITQAGLSQIINGKRLPSLELAIRIESVTGISCRGWSVDPHDRRHVPDRRQGGRRAEDRALSGDRRRSAR